MTFVQLAEKYLSTPIFRTHKQIFINENEIPAAVPCMVLQQGFVILGCIVWKADYKNTALCQLLVLLFQRKYYVYTGVQLNILGFDNSGSIGSFHTFSHRHIVIKPGSVVIGIQISVKHTSYAASAC